jgi:hypothetical protein
MLYSNNYSPAMHSHHHPPSAHNHDHAANPAGAGLPVAFLAAGLGARLLSLLPLLALLWALIAWAILSDA